MRSEKLYILFQRERERIQQVASNRTESRASFTSGG